MKDRFFIQVRSKRINPMVDIINSSGNQEDWSSLPWSYDAFEKAQKECEFKIQNGHRARDIRVVEVVGTFSANIQVNATSDKYSS